MARPIDPKRAIHLVLKSQKAKGSDSFLQPKHEKRISALIEEASRHYGVKVYRFTNVGNHLHLLVKTQTRRGFQNFLRVITGKIAILITKAKKGEKKGKFWDGLSFTRVVQWGKDFTNLDRYFTKNQIESFGYGTSIARALVKQGFIKIVETG